MDRLSDCQPQRGDGSWSVMTGFRCSFYSFHPIVYLLTLIQCRYTHWQWKCGKSGSKISGRIFRRKLASVFMYLASLLASVLMDLASFSLIPLLSTLDCEFSFSRNTAITRTAPNCCSCLNMMIPFPCPHMADVVSQINQAWAKSKWFLLQNCWCDILPEKKYNSFISSGKWWTISINTSVLSDTTTVGYFQHNSCETATIIVNVIFSVMTISLQLVCHEQWRAEGWAERGNLV